MSSAFVAMTPGILRRSRDVSKSFGKSMWLKATLRLHEIPGYPGWRRFFEIEGSGICRDAEGRGEQK